MDSEEKKSMLSFYARYSSLAFQMIAIILVGAFGGKALDSWLELSFPTFTLVFTVLGVVGSIIYGVRDLFRSNNNKKNTK